MAPTTYPASTSAAALHLFLDWFGRRFARSVRIESTHEGEAALEANVTVGRHWPLAVAIADTIAAQADARFEAARAAVEQRFDAEGLAVALWLPPGAVLPVFEPGLSVLAAAAAAAREIAPGRLEARLPVSLHIRRTSLAGSVATVAGGLAPWWAKFTNRLAGTYQLNSTALNRLPAAEEEREALIEAIIAAASSPAADAGIEVAAEDAWTLNPLEGRSCVLGLPPGDEEGRGPVLRKAVRRLLARLGESPAEASTRALVLLGAATYAPDEKLSWTLKGMDPALYAGWDFVVVVADGVVRPLIEPAAAAIPWESAAP